VRCFIKGCLSLKNYLFFFLSLFQVSEIVLGIHSALKGITNEQTQNGALHSLRTLTGHHLILVADEFLRFPLPHDEQAVKALKTLAADAKIGPLITKHYMDLLATSQPYIEKPKSKKEYTKEATKITMALTCSLGEMFQVPEMEEVVRNVLPTMFGVLLLRIGVTNAIEKGNAEGRETNKYVDLSFFFFSFLVLNKSNSRSGMPSRRSRACSRASRTRRSSRFSTRTRTRSSSTRPATTPRS